MKSSPTLDYELGPVFWNREQEKAVDEIDRLSEFFDIEMDPLEFEPTYQIPRLGDSYSKLYLNPGIPWGGVHEARHYGHLQVLEDLSERNPDALKEYYISALDDLGSKTKQYTSFTHSMMGVQRLLTGERDSGELESQLEELDSENLAELLFSRNAETDLQMEVFAHDSRLELGSMFGAAGAIWINETLKGGELLYNSAISPSDSPETYAVVGLSALVGGALVTDCYRTGRPEPLVESRLESLDKEDRKRAMLYNPQVEPEIDEFLDTLDSYGIE